jgi:hypothetical protein
MIEVIDMASPLNTVPCCDACGSLMSKNDPDVDGVFILKGQVWKCGYCESRLLNDRILKS